jgi:SAM-dependent methyltransferase
MADSAIVHRVASYYSARLAEHGATARGVDWNGTYSQELRFAQLLRVLDDPGQSFSMNDVGCGYGALADFLCRTGYHFEYVGYDVSNAMIEAARKRHQHTASVRFADADAALSPTPAEYTVASGIFNVKLDVDVERWQAYVIDAIERIAAASQRGFAFNMLTAYSDPERMRPNLYYADPSFYFDYCMRAFGRRVALLHDYELFEFTLIVKRGER